MLQKGDTAPDFTLSATPEKMVHLKDLRGKNVILAFYPADWSPVCSDQMALYNEMLHYFDKYNAILLGISVDGAWCHAAFASARQIHFDLLSDFEPKGAVAKLYGVYEEKRGLSQRALFVIDANGIIQWSYLSPVNENPGADGILAALENLKTN
ncbi:peroxiredoxin [Chitinophaga arvensicola]|uniref:Peroxiredoxin n=1 Tax=Chitinophaga arvensicola TaxID=29529 RepID=A0A1I0SCL9_9BACT|nr:peroxiredoxin [Chitinophaga arvensicola]SEW54870.1 Peroxiredoxin [Chitinophaga arvensicola]